MTRREEVKSTIEKHIDDNKIDLKLEFPWGSRKELITLYDFSEQEVKHALSVIRGERGSRTRSSKNASKNVIDKTVISDLQTYCLSNGLYRSSNSETAACKKIIAAMKSLVPRGGKGMLIGTPTAFCASQSMNNNLFITDNFEVATILKFTTDVPITIVIGNAINADKATLKAQHWRSNSTTKDSIIHIDRIDRFSYYRYVSNFASGGDKCKVILLTSGIWKDSYVSKRKREKKGMPYLNLDYETPSNKLTNEYPNLHILAMTKELVHGFSIRYLNNGKHDLLQWKEK